MSFSTYQRLASGIEGVEILSEPLMAAKSTPVKIGNTLHVCPECYSLMKKSSSGELEFLMHNLRFINADLWTPVESYGHEKLHSQEFFGTEVKP